LYVRVHEVHGHNEQLVLRRRYSVRELQQTRAHDDIVVIAEEEEERVQCNGQKFKTGKISRMC